jgi:hypothetical protein
MDKVEESTNCIICCDEQAKKVNIGINGMRLCVDCESGLVAVVGGMARLALKSRRYGHAVAREFERRAKCT